MSYTTAVLPREYSTLSATLMKLVDVTQQGLKLMRRLAEPV